MIERMGGWVVVRGAAYGLGLLVFSILAGVGLLTVDQAEDLTVQLDRILLVVGSLAGGGISATALKNLEKAPDAVAAKTSPADVAAELAKRVDELVPVVAGQVGGQVRDVLARVETSNVEAVAGALSRLEAAIEQVTRSRGLSVDPAPAGVVQPSGPVDPVLAQRLELEKRAGAS